MKYISFILVFSLTLILSGCFSRNEVEVTQSGWENIPGQQEIDTISEEEINQEETDQDNIPPEDEALFSEDENQLDDEDVVNNDSNTQVDTEVEASGSGSIRADELESYEEDLEALFEDILWEIDAGE